MHSQIENGFGIGRFDIGTEIALAFELETVTWLRLREKWFHVSIQNAQRIRVQCLNESLVTFLGVFLREETIVHTEFRFLGVSSRDPMNRGFDFAAIGRIAA